MDKKPNFKSQDNETNRSILKSNSPRPIRNSTSSSKGTNGHGIFKKTSLYEAKSLNDVLSTSIRETRSEAVSHNMDHFKGIIRTKIPDKQAKKVQFLDHIIKSDDDNENQFRCLLDHDQPANLSKFHNLLKTATDSNLVQLIDDKTDNLLDLLSAIPSEIPAREDLHRNNVNVLSKMTSVERIFVVLLTILFCIMVLKHFRYDWILPSTVKSELKGSEIITLMGRNVKRMCKNLMSIERYFWYSAK
ncbi:uncharacterized protein LOC119081236 [Bradysia coprophila]|uniref:uncharacterized protein LOC119081236 n=1 Tax=Bradysia coprophila TaxID=38358 RepID=UPI00187DA9C6|nr:uncharacterized protein LOC119081236 [Bradysia coprophila]